MAAVQAAGQGGQAGSLSLVAFIQGLGDQLEALFRHPYCCVSVLRSLRPLSRQLLLRFACTGGDVSTGARGPWAGLPGDPCAGCSGMRVACAPAHPCPLLPSLMRRLTGPPAPTPSRCAALVSSWARPGPHGEPCLQAALAELAALRLLSRVARGGQASWALNPHFHAQLRHAMCSGCVARRLGCHAPARANERSLPAAAPSRLLRPWPGPGRPAADPASLCPASPESPPG